VRHVGGRGRLAARVAAGVTGIAMVLAVCLLAPQNSGSHSQAGPGEGNRRLVLGEEKLWYGSAAGKPGVVLGTWASQKQGASASLVLPAAVAAARKQLMPRAHQAAPRPQLLIKNSAGPQLEEEEPEEEEVEPPAEEAEAEAPAVAAEAEAPVDESEVPAETAGGEAPAEPLAAVTAVAACDGTCRAAYATDMAEIAKLGDELEKLHGTCTAMMRVFNCECSRCTPNMEAGDALQKTLCEPAGLRQLHEAGGPCMGFATGFCGAPMSASAFCQEGSWIPPMGSPQWMQVHKVVDPGDDGGAGVRLVANQAPAYAHKVAAAMSEYLSAGAIKERDTARLEGIIGSEIQSMEPVHESMGIFDFLPFRVPFLESVTDKDKPILEEDHKLQLTNFGEEISPAQAEEYGDKVKEWEEELEEKGVTLPAHIATDLHELETAAEEYDGPVDSGGSWLPF